jgi:hypothetical protein
MTEWHMCPDIDKKRPPAPDSLFFIGIYFYFLVVSAIVGKLGT